jgi:DNA repair exonuclease SbcCD ATPase subunit
MAERIEEIRVDGWDEDGFHIRVSTDDDEHDFRVTDTEVARALLAELDAKLPALRSWVDEHDHEFAAYLIASPSERARVLGRVLDLADPDAYEERAEALRAAGDDRRKAERESGRGSR